MAAPITNDKLYDLVDRTRQELKGDILRVEATISTAVNGPLRAAQEDITDLKVKDATLSTKVYMLVFIISTATSALMSGLVLFLVNRLSSGK